MRILFGKDDLSPGSIKNNCFLLISDTNTRHLAWAERSVCSFLRRNSGFIKNRGSLQNCLTLPDLLPLAVDGSDWLIKALLVIGFTLTSSCIRPLKGKKGHICGYSDIFCINRCSSKNQNYMNGFGLGKHLFLPVPLLTYTNRWKKAIAW